MMTLGFNDAKRKAITALLNGPYLHEADRSNVDTKNLLLNGQVSASMICDVFKRSQGQDHSSSAHHQAASIQVRIIRRDGWYIKFYCVDPSTVFISVHQ
jgi:hypothetical protein